VGTGEGVNVGVKVGLGSGVKVDVGEGLGEGVAEGEGVAGEGVELAGGAEGRVLGSPQDTVKKRMRARKRVCRFISSSQ